MVELVPTMQRFGDHTALIFIHTPSMCGGGDCKSCGLAGVIFVCSNHVSLGWSVNLVLFRLAVEAQ